MTGDTMAGMASSADDRAAVGDAVEQQGDGQAQEQLAHQRRHDEDDRVPHRGDEPLVAQQRLGVVPCADERGIRADREVEVAQ
jgi:hypothetical protein